MIIVIVIVIAMNESERIEKIQTMMSIVEPCGYKVNAVVFLLEARSGQKEKKEAQNREIDHAYIRRIKMTLSVSLFLASKRNAPSKYFIDSFMDSFIQKANPLVACRYIMFHSTVSVSLCLCEQHTGTYTLSLPPNPAQSIAQMTRSFLRWIDTILKQNSPALILFPL